MRGTKLEQARDGIIRALDAMAKNNHVGFLAFADTIKTRIPAAPLIKNRFAIAEAAQNMRARGNTALYDELHGEVPVAKIMSEDSGQAAIVAVVENLPFGTVMLVIFLLMSFIYSATTVDSSAYAIA